MKMIIKLIFTLIAVTTAVTLILNFNHSPPQPAADPLTEKPAATRPVSRFLQQKPRNPRAADHCHKDNEVCNYIPAETGGNTTCCNNKCIDLSYDNKNCGACKKKCAFTESCCRGECVNLAYDKRHCGSCNNKCMPRGYCIYGMCDYA